MTDKRASGNLGRRNGDGHYSRDTHLRERISDNNGVEKLVENPWVKLGVRGVVILIAGMMAIILWFGREMYKDFKDNDASLATAISANLKIVTDNTKLLSSITEKLIGHEQRLNSHEEWLRSVSRSRRADDR